jgi:hypothetical protein
MPADQVVLYFYASTRPVISVTAKRIASGTNLSGLYASAW